MVGQEGGGPGRGRCACENVREEMRKISFGHLSLFLKLDITGD